MTADNTRVDFRFEIRRLRKLGLEPTLKPEGEAEKFANVLFSAPPAGNKDAYVSDVCNPSSSPCFVCACRQRPLNLEAGKWQ